MCWNKELTMFDENNKVKAIIASAFIYAVFVGSYWFFSSYKPKALSEIREVRGYQVQEKDAFDLPYPKYATGLASDQTLNTKKFTFQTDKSPQEIQSFYSNILLADDWKLKKEGALDNFYTSEYKKDNYTVMVWSYYDSDAKMTFASVEVMRFDE
jgi:hypothetical protein